MAFPGSGIVNQGLQRLGINASAVGGSSTVGSSQTVTRYIMTMSVDDNASNFAAADTTLQTSRGALTNEYDQLLDGFATRSGQTVTHVCTLGTGVANFVIKGVALHDDTTTNVTATSATLVAGIAGQSLQKTSNFSLAITIAVLYSDNS